MRIYQSINKIYLENAEGNNIAALEIEYRGNANLTSTFPNSCLARHNDNKIVVINMSNTPIIDLFEYSGDIMLLSCRATDRELNQFNLSVKTDETDEWQTKNGVWEDLVGPSSFPEKLNKSSKKVLNRKSKLDMTQNNLSTKEGEDWVLSDKKTPYTGSYHVHSTSGQAMTGEIHSMDSENIYLKDGLGRVEYVPKSKKIIKKRITSRKGRSTPSSSGGGY